MQFRKDINGLRAIAVIAVVLFHFNDSWMPGGFAGVDVFFVISGFLMTGIIFRGLEQKNFSIWKFYIARANRIIPALAVLCCVLLVFGWFYLTPIDYRALGKHIASSMGFLSNFIYWLESGYFDVGSHEKWLLHTWSLSVEWQFYIIYPVVLVTFRNFMSVKAIKLTVFIGTILGFSFCIIATYKWPDSSYYLLSTRAWEMMFGGLAYLYPMTIKKEWKRPLEWLGLAFIFGSYFLISKDNLWPGYLAIFPVLGSFLIIQAQCNDSFITSNIVFQKLGAWSYSIYLWHWPIVVVIYSFSLSEVFIYFGIILSVILGFLSYKYIEKVKFKTDFYKVASYFKCKPIYFVIIVSFIGSYVYLSDGINSPVREVVNSKESKYVTIYHRNNYNKYMKEGYSPECNFYYGRTSKVDGISETCIKNGTGGIFIWGDSHAQALSYGIRKVFPNININQVATSGCRPLIKEDIKTVGENKKACDLSNKMAKKVILDIMPKVIILAQRLEHDENDYKEILSYLNEHNLNSKLILVGPVPQWQPSLPSIIAKRHFNKDEVIINDHSLVSKVLSVNSQLHTEYDSSEIEYISIVDQLCTKNGCLAKVDNNNTPLVWDYGHLSLEGSIYVVEKILKNKLNSYL